MLGVDAQPVAATLLYQVPVRDCADESMVTGHLCAYHFCCPVVLQLHHTAVAAVGNLAVPYPAAGVILLMDIRHPMKEFDLQVLGWCHVAGLPAQVLLTKSDKLKRGPAQAALLSVRQTLASIHPDASIQLFSALKKTGTQEAIQVLDSWLGFIE